MNNKLSLIIYTFGHFAADFASVYIILHTLGFTAEGVICILIYNFCAFVLQLPFGLLADRTGGFCGYAMAGCLVIAASAFVTPLPYVCALLCGIGNAFYHVGGGGSVLNNSDNVTDAGIFVSSGALGLYLGRLFSSEKYSLILALGFVIATFALLIMLLRNGGTDKHRFELKFTKSGTVAAVCIFAVTLLRSYAGLSLAPKLPVGLWAAAMTGGIVSGKALGGIIADRTSRGIASFVSLIAAAVMYIFSKSAVCAVLAIFFFNMTMPITLNALTQIFSGAKTFAFGVLTVALFIGFLPYCLGISLPLSQTVQFVAVCGLSLILLMRGLRDAR